MLAERLRPEHIKGLARHLGGPVGEPTSAVYVTDATKALKDQLRDGILLLKPGVDVDAYFKRYAFTLGLLIWTPFSVEEPAEIENWDFPWQVITLAHENWHRHQFLKYGGAPFAWDYLTNPESRAHYEYEAYRTTLELWPVLYDGAFFENLEGLAESLKAYAVRDEDIETMLINLRLANDIIKRGGIITPTAQETKKYLESVVA